MYPFQSLRPQKSPLESKRSPLESKILPIGRNIARRDFVFVLRSILQVFSLIVLPLEMGTCSSSKARILLTKNKARISLSLLCFSVYKDGTNGEAGSPQ